MAAQPVRALKPSVNLAIRLPHDYSVLLREIAKDLDLTISALIRRSVERYAATEIHPDLAKALADARTRALSA
jgi:hypothetical protein